MANKMKKKLMRIFGSRTFILLVVFAVMSAILIVRLFQLQVVNGQEYADNFTVMTTRKRVLESTRGNIYDVNGNQIAYNELSNSVTIEDNGTYDSVRKKNLALNGEILKLTNMILEKGDTLAHDFHIYVDEDGNYAFDVDEGRSRDRFRADIYGYKTIDEMSDEEKNSSADQIVSYLAGGDRFAIFDSDNPYTEKELSDNGLSADLSKEEVLNIIIVRYQLLLISYQRYVPVVVAEDVSDETVAAVEENARNLQGVKIQEDSKRVYKDAEAFAPIIGYTGKPSAEELADLKKENDNYTSNSIIGKTGIEKVMETTLQGTDGSEEITVNNLGTVLSVNQDSRVEPVQGNDVYLTLDAELQTAAYKILEQRIAGILVNKITNEKYGPENMEDADQDLYIPIYDVYNALIENSVIDITHFSGEDASDTEKKVYSDFTSRQQEVMNWLNGELNGEGTDYKDLDDEHKDYVDYIYGTYLTQDTGIIDTDKINSSDEIYKAFREDGTVSLGEFLLYAAKQDWVDTSKLSDENTYMDSNEIFTTIISNMDENLVNKAAFSRIIYKYMLLDDDLAPADLCQILYDQGILDKTDETYSKLEDGSIKPYDLIVSKIRSLEITPAQLALDPCSGSIVINDPDTGQVRALVTYPGYDNNRLSNEMDTDYYNKLYADLSTPFYNKATQQLTAPGSTYKPLVAAAGLNEGVISRNTYIECNGLFGAGFMDQGDQVHCWLRSGHGSLNVVGGIENSCNVFFCTVGYRLGLDDDGKFSQATALSKLQKYSSMFSLDKKTGLEITESSPHVSDSMAIPSAIGQGTHQYTTSQLSRYAATIANNGTSYELTLLDKTTDTDGNTIEEYSPKVAGKANFSDSVWDAIHEGMKGAKENNTQLSGLDLDLKIKTGTAQEANNRPSHSLVIGHAHKDGTEDIAFAIRIAFGYGSSNACLVANDVLSYYYGLKSETEILTGEAAENGVSSTAVTD